MGCGGSCGCGGTCGDGGDAAAGTSASVGTATLEAPRPSPHRREPARCAKPVGFPCGILGDDHSLGPPHHPRAGDGTPVPRGHLQVPAARCDGTFSVAPPDTWTLPPICAPAPGSGDAVPVAPGGTYAEPAVPADAEGRPFDAAGRPREYSSGRGGRVVFVALTEPLLPPDTRPPHLPATGAPPGGPGPGGGGSVETTPAVSDAGPHGPADPTVAPPGVLMGKVGGCTCSCACEFIWDSPNDPRGRAVLDPSPGGGGGGGPPPAPLGGGGGGPKTGGGGEGPRTPLQPSPPPGPGDPVTLSGSAAAAFDGRASRRELLVGTTGEPRLVERVGAAGFELRPAPPAAADAAAVSETPVRVPSAAPAAASSQRTTTVPARAVLPPLTASVHVIAMPEPVRTARGPATPPQLIGIGPPDSNAAAAFGVDARDATMFVATQTRGSSFDLSAPSLAPGGLFTLGPLHEADAIGSGAGEPGAPGVARSVPSSGASALRPPQQPPQASRLTPRDSLRNQVRPWAPFNPGGAAALRRLREGVPEPAPRVPPTEEELAESAARARTPGSGAGASINAALGIATSLPQAPRQGPDSDSIADRPGRSPDEAGPEGSPGVAPASGRAAGTVAPIGSADLERETPRGGGAGPGIAAVVAGGASHARWVVASQVRRAASLTRALAESTTRTQLAELSTVFVQPSWLRDAALDEMRRAEEARLEGLRTRLRAIETEAREWRFQERSTYNAVPLTGRRHYLEASLRIYQSDERTTARALQRDGRRTPLTSALDRAARTQGEAAQRIAMRTGAFLDDPSDRGQTQQTVSMRLATAMGSIAGSVPPLGGGPATGLPKSAHDRASARRDLRKLGQHVADRVAETASTARAQARAGAQVLKSANSSSVGGAQVVQDAAIAAEAALAKLRDAAADANKKAEAASRESTSKDAAAATDAAREAAVAESNLAEASRVADDAIQNLAETVEQEKERRKRPAKPDDSDEPEDSEEDPASAQEPPKPPPVRVCDGVPCTCAWHCPPPLICHGCVVKEPNPIGKHRTRSPGSGELRGGGVRNDIMAMPDDGPQPGGAAQIPGEPSGVATDPDSPVESDPSLELVFDQIRALLDAREALSAQLVALRDIRRRTWYSLSDFTRANVDWLISEIDGPILKIVDGALSLGKTVFRSEWDLADRRPRVKIDTAHLQDLRARLSRAVAVVTNMVAVATAVSSVELTFDALRGQLGQLNFEAGFSRIRSTWDGSVRTMFGDVAASDRTYMPAFRSLMARALRGENVLAEVQTKHGAFVERLVKSIDSFPQRVQAARDAEAFLLNAATLVSLLLGIGEAYVAVRGAIGLLTAGGGRLGLQLAAGGSAFGATASAAGLTALTDASVALIAAAASNEAAKRIAESYQKGQLGERIVSELTGNSRTRGAGYQTREVGRRFGVRFDSRSKSRVFDWLIRARKRIIEVKYVRTLESRAALRDLFKVLDNTRKWRAELWLRGGALDRASQPLLRELIKRVESGKMVIHSFDVQGYLGELTVDALKAILRAR